MHQNCAKVEKCLAVHVYALRLPKDTFRGHVSPAFHFTPLAKLDDGLIDIVVAKKCGLMKTVALFDDLKAPKNGAHVEKDDVLYIQCKSLKIDTGDREGLVGVDGEVTLKTPVKLNCLRGAFCTFV